MAFELDNIDNAKLREMCSESMAYLMCTYDFGIVAIRRDLLLKATNQFVTHNLGFFNSLISSDLLAKENAFCLSLAERESKKFFGYLGEEESQLYHYAFWIAVNALMLKEQGSSKFFYKTFKEAMNNCLTIVENNCSSEVLVQWLAMYTAGRIKRVDLGSALSNLIDLHIELIHNRNNIELHSEILKAYKENSFAVDQALRLIESPDSMFKLIFKRIEIHKKNETEVEGSVSDGNTKVSDNDIDLFMEEVRNYLDSQRENAGIDDESSEKNSGTFGIFDKDKEIKSTVTQKDSIKQLFSAESQDILKVQTKDREAKSTCIVSKTQTEDKDTKPTFSVAKTQTEDAESAACESKTQVDCKDKKSSYGVFKYLVVVALGIVIVLAFIRPIAQSGLDTKEIRSSISTKIDAQYSFDQNKYLNAKSCISNKIGISAHELKALTGAEKDFLVVLESEDGERCSNLDINSMEYKRAISDIDPVMKEAIENDARKDLYKVGKLLKELYYCGFEEKNDLINVFFKLKLLGYEIAEDVEIKAHTIQAIKTFQRSVGLEGSGRLTDSLMSALDAELVLKENSRNIRYHNNNESRYVAYLDDFSIPMQLYEYGVGSSQIISAANGNIEAMLDISEVLFERNNYKEAFNWVKLAAKKGSDIAQLKLSELYSEGIGCSIDLRKSKYWLEKSANAGNMESQIKLADYLLSGMGGVKDPEQAVEILTKTCREGSTSSCGKLGYLKLKGIGTKKDVTNGRNQLKEAALLGDAASEFYCYEIIISSKNSKFEKIAKELLLDSAKKNFAPAIFALHSNKLKSTSLSKEEKSQSIFMLKEIADSGYTDAQVFMGRYLAFSKQNNKQLDDARVYLIKAVLKGRTDAMLALGDVYHFLDKDKERAKRWFKLACKQGNKEACIESNRDSGEIVISY